MAGDEAAGRSFIDSFEDTPVILMSECSTTGDVLRAVKLGAVDWLDKPLSVLKLRNIWQHSVRKVGCGAGAAAEQGGAASRGRAAAVLPRGQQGKAAQPCTGHNHAQGTSAALPRGWCALPPHSLPLAVRRRAFLGSDPAPAPEPPLPSRHAALRCADDAALLLL